MSGRLSILKTSREFFYYLNVPLIGIVSIFTTSGESETYNLGCSSLTTMVPTLLSLFCLTSLFCCGSYGGCFCGWVSALSEELRIFAWDDGDFYFKVSLFSLLLRGGIRF